MEATLVANEKGRRVKYNLAENFDQANQIWLADKEQKGLRKSFLFSHNYLFEGYDLFSQMRQSRRGH